MKTLFLTISLFLACSLLNAQDDLMDLLESETEETTDYTIATFKSIRLVNGHTIETPAHGVMQMLISHRFGRINGGLYELFGLDQANIRVGLSYGVTDWLTIGVGRSNVFKTYDGYAKAKLLRQSTGKRVMPFSVTAVAGIAANSLRFQDTTRENFFSSRLDYYYQILIARKFSERLSIQVMPTMVHQNLVATRDIQNDLYAVGIGGRYKLTKGVSLNAEYYYRLTEQVAPNTTNSFAIGFDIETGGHVFQLMFANSRNMTDNLFLTETTGKWDNGDIHFGFAISRVFTVHRPK